MLAAIAVLVASLPALGQGLTLRDAEREALAKSSAIAGATARNELAAARRNQARAAWLPRVDASQSVTRSDNPVFVFGSLLEQGEFTAKHFDQRFLNDPEPLTNRRLAVNVRYTLFDQLRRMNLSKQADQGVAQATLGSEETRQRVRLEVVTRFYGLALAEQRRDVAREAVRSAEADAGAIRDRVEQGLLVESDQLSAEVQLASFRQRLLEAEGELAVARAALNTTLGRLPGEEVGLDGAIPQRTFPEIAVAAALQRGYASRPDLRRSASAAETAKLQLALVRSSRLPRVDSFASWGASNGDPDRAIGVAIGIDLFDPARRAQTAEARAAIDGARAAESSERDRATMEIVTAWHRAHVAQERIAVAATSVARAEEAARIVHDRYEHGLTTITEQLRAQTALVTARLELLAARHDYVIGYAELLRATGGLIDVEAFL
jgi:outer membrane protein TolC